MIFPRRLFWRVYLTLLASLVAVAFLMGAFWWLVGEGSRERQHALRFDLSHEIIPARDSPPGALEAAMQRLGDEIGADDYLPKPFNPRELQARIRAITRRGRAAPSADGALRFGRLQIDRESRTVRLDGDERTLTSHQFDLLAALAENAGRVLNRERLMDLVKGEELDAFDRSIDVHISRIRSAIEDDPKHPRRIITVRGAGYVFARKQDNEA